MGKNPCCAKVGLNRGVWTSAEDKILTDYIQLHGEGRWRSLPKKAGIYKCVHVYVIWSDLVGRKWPVICSGEYLRNAHPLAGVRLLACVIN